MVGDLDARGAELARLKSFVESDEGAATLVVSGAAGIGKTTLFRSAADHAIASGRRLLSATCRSGETQLSLTLLADLLTDVGDTILGRLPNVQRRVIEAVLFKGEAVPSESGWRPLAVSFLEVLRAVTDEGPVVIAIDDIQWMDASSAQVLRFAGPRIADEPVRFLLTQRSGESDPLDVGRWDVPMERLVVGPMTVEGLDRALRTRAGLALGRVHLQQVHAATDGNPFYALEIARHLATRPPSPGRPLPIPPDLTRLLLRRFEDLSDDALEVLLVAALSARPTSGLVDRVLDDAVSARRGRKEAVAAGLIEIGEDDVARFTHPLLAACVHSQALSEDRRPLHARLAALSTDEEERARHAALAIVGPNEEVALRLEEAAASAAGRGAPAAAAELCAMAVEATDPSDVVRIQRRQLERARYLSVAGDSAVALAELRRLSETGCNAEVRVEALIALVEAFDDPNAIPAVDAMLAEIDDLHARAALHRHAVYLKAMSGLGDAALEHGRLAVSDASTTDDLALQATCLTSLAFVEVLRGSPEAESTIDRARSLLQKSGLEIPLRMHPDLIDGYRLHACDLLPAARAAFEDVRFRAHTVGDVPGVVEADLHLAEVAFREGKWAEADERARSVLTTMEQVGEEFLAAGLYICALMDAALGRTDDALDKATDGRRQSEEVGETLFLTMNAWVQGFACLAIGDHARAYEALAPLPEIARASGDLDTGFLMWETDLIESMIATGLTEEAERYIVDVETRAIAQGRARGEMVAARGRAMLASLRGDDDAAIAYMDTCDGHAHRLGDQPFERARNLLLRGWVQRRAKMKAASRSTLAQAELMFASLGATTWAERANEEQRRIGGRTAAPDELTPTEAQVASLVASGASNREVAERLFISVKTVEANLSRIYRKLNVRSRSELAASYERVG